MISNLTLGTYAKNATQSAYPGLFPDHAWLPILGQQGNTIESPSGVPMKSSGVIWNSSSLNYADNAYSSQIFPYEKKELTVVVDLMLTSVSTTNRILARESATAYYYGIQIYTSGCVVMFYSGSSSVYSTSNLVLNKRSIIICYFSSSGSGCESYIGGNLVGSGKLMAFNARSSFPLDIGRVQVDGVYYYSPGFALYGIQLFGRKLSSSEITDISANPYKSFQKTTSELTKKFMPYKWRGTPSYKVAVTR